jgi:PAS domain-containing protein
MLEGKGQFPYEIRIVRKDGEVRWIIQTLTSIIYNGRTALLGNFIDITEKKEIEAMIVESEERYRILTEQSLIGVYLLQDNLFKYVNPAFARMHGYKRAEMVGRLGPLDLIIPEDKEKIFKRDLRRSVG